MMHLKYPKTHGYFTWEELGCLARALGFQRDMFSSQVPDECKSGLEAGLSIKVLVDMIDVQKYFNGAVDRSVNIHTDEWNLSVIKKSITLLDNHLVSFAELQAVRLAFQVYEAIDSRGMLMDWKVVQRALKMCSRVISPLKMMQRLKHMSAHFEEEGRIQLHEFLDLLMWCETYTDLEVGPPSLSTSTDGRQLFPLEDFSCFLSHYDERLARDLDTDYVTLERKFQREKHGSRKMPKDVPPVDPEVRRRQVKYHRNRYQFLHHEIGSSETKVHQAKAGYVRDRPVSAPDLMMYTHAYPSMMGLSTPTPRPRTVMELVGHLIRPHTASTEGKTAEHECSVSCNVMRPRVEWYSRPQTPATVVQQDLVGAENQIEALRFEMETMEMKYQEMLEEDLDYLLPGYREKVAARNREPKETPVPPKPKKTPRPSPETIQRLAYHRRTCPAPAHAKACDARFRGWNKATTQSSSHCILTTPYFDNSPNGQLMAKLHFQTARQAGRKDYTRRYTKKDIVACKAGRKNNASSSSRRPAACEDFREDRPDGENPEVFRDGQQGPASPSPGSREMAETEKVAGGSDRGSRANPRGSETSCNISRSDLQVYRELGEDDEQNMQQVTSAGDATQRRWPSVGTSQESQRRRPLHDPTADMAGDPTGLINKQNTELASKAECSTSSPRGKVVELAKLGKLVALEGIMEMENEADKASIHTVNSGGHRVPQHGEGRDISMRPAVCNRDARSPVNHRKPALNRSVYRKTSETPFGSCTAGLVTCQSSSVIDLLPNRSEPQLNVDDLVRPVRVVTGKKRKNRKRYARLADRVDGAGSVQLKNRLLKGVPTLEYSC